jgi:hypothetical protein
MRLIETGLPEMFPEARFASKQEELCVDIALMVIVGRGWVDPEHVDVELVSELCRLRRSGHPILRAPIRFNGELLHDLCMQRPGDYLARAWENEQELRYQRECCPRWRCPYCLTDVAEYDGFGPKSMRFFSLNRRGEFVDEVSDCPGCGHSIRETIKSGGPVQLELPLPDTPFEFAVPPWLEGKPR